MGAVTTSASPALFVSLLLGAGKDVARFLPSRVLTLLFFYYTPSNLVYALETIQFAYLAVLQTPFNPFFSYAEINHISYL